MHPLTMVYTTAAILLGAASALALATLLVWGAGTLFVYVSKEYFRRFGNVTTNFRYLCDWIEAGRPVLQEYVRPDGTKVRIWMRLDPNEDTDYLRTVESTNAVNHGYDPVKATGVQTAKAGAS